MATRVGRGRIWLTSLNSPTLKPPVRRKDLGDISHISRVRGNFSSNFVAMATRVGRRRISLAPFNSPTPKTPLWTQGSGRYLSYKPSYSRFCLKFRCHGNKGRSEVNLTLNLNLNLTVNFFLQICVSNTVTNTNSAILLK